MDEHISVSYLKSLVRPILSVKESLTVERTIDERGVKLTLGVDKGDMGRIIGKGGQTIQAMRTLLHQLGGISKEIISIVVKEPESTNYYKN